MPFQIFPKLFGYIKGKVKTDTSENNNERKRLYKTICKGNLKNNK